MKITEENGFNGKARMPSLSRFDFAARWPDSWPDLVPKPRVHSGERFPETTDLGMLHGTRLAIVCDDDNLRLSSQNRARRFSYRQVLERLAAVADVVLPMAVVSADRGDRRRQAYLEKRGWRVLAIPRETAWTCRGPVLKSNVDFDLAFELGHLINRGRFNTVLLATGDGDLAVAIGRGVRRNRPGLRLFTMSVPGSGSARLRTRPDLFDGHIVVGRDLSRSWGGDAGWE